MTKNPVAAACAAVLINLAGGAAGLGQANAAVYTGIFDPTFGSFEWSGTQTFSVDDACLLTNGWRQNNDGYTACNVQLIGGSLTVTEISSGLTQTVTFAQADAAAAVPPGTGILDNPGLFFGLYIANNQLAGVDSGWTSPDMAFTFGEATYNWELQWESGQAPVLGFGAFASVAGDPVNAQTCSPPGQNCVSQGSALTVTFNRVPEPGSMGLALAALGGAWLGRRRRRGRAS